MLSDPVNGFNDYRNDVERDQSQKKDVELAAEVIARLGRLQKLPNTAFRNHGVGFEASRRSLLLRPTLEE